MPLAGTGMLLTSMNIDASDEADFNRWYDREHLEERVAIEGFIEARRYAAIEGSPKYLSLYSTETFDVLDSPAYRTALANQTAWSRENMARFRNMIRVVARITVSSGSGRGAVLGILRLRPASGSENALRTELTEKLDPSGLDGIISMHLLESDPVLSGPTAEIPAAKAGAGDWFVLIDGTDIGAITAAFTARFAADVAAMRATRISSGTYDLMWDLARSDLPSA